MISYFTLLLLLTVYFIKQLKGYTPWDLDPQCLFEVCIAVHIKNHRLTPLTNPLSHLENGLLVDIMKPVQPNSTENIVSFAVLSMP